MLRHGMRNTKIYKVWETIKARCYRKSHTSFMRYGGRGITVCDEWKNDFMSFHEWAIKSGYKDNLSIDRIDNDGNYEPNNCRFTDRYTQTQNTTRLMKTNRSGYRGVCKYGNKWKAQIRHMKDDYFLGIYKDKVHAAMAYDTFVIVYGTNHTQNFKQP